MAVRAQQRKVVQLGLRSLDEALQRLSVVRFNKASASLTIALLEVEVTRLAAEPPKLPERPELALTHEFSASLPHAMKSGQQTPLFGLDYPLIIFTGNDRQTEGITLQEYGIRRCRSWLLACHSAVPRRQAAPP